MAAFVLVARTALLVIVSLYSGLSSAWDPSQGTNCSSTSGTFFDPSCPAEQPFCMYITGTGNINQCRECRGDCDCGENYYCSTQAPVQGETGYCRKFYMAGAKCFPMSNTQLLNPSIDPKIKCAIVGNSTITNTPQIEYQGLCIQGICRQCNPASAAVTCVGEYFGPPRLCVFPGLYSTIHSQNWSPGKFYEEPLRVWATLIFLAFLFAVFTGTFTLCLVWKMWKRKTRNDPVNPRVSPLTEVTTWATQLIDDIVQKIPGSQKEKPRFDQYTEFATEDTTLLPGSRSNKP